MDPLSNNEKAPSGTVIQRGLLCLLAGLCQELFDYIGSPYDNQRSYLYNLSA
jgi:hypothetical protein